MLLSGMLAGFPAHPILAHALQDPVTADLLARLQQADEAVRARDDFLAIAAHELRSPLHALSLRIAALERMASRRGDAALAQQLQRAARSVDRYVRHSVTLLDLSRLHACALHPAPERVAADEAVRNVVEDYRDEAEFCGATLRGEADDDVVGLWDPQMVERVLANLVSNAIKYGNGSPVLVRARMEGETHACFEVSDRGPGIPEADRVRIFQKFERVVSGSNDRGGFGLGLWIVGRMVAAHEGTVEVTQPAEGGSLFRVVLPLKPQFQPAFRP